MDTQQVESTKRRRRPKPLLAIRENKQNGSKSSKPTDTESSMSLGTIFLTLFTGLALSFVVYQKMTVPSEVFKPFNGTEFPMKSVLGDYFWGSLISGHYFGLRNALPNSTMVSFMWFRNQIEQDGLPVQHWCEMNDRVKSFIWNYNDFYNFGQQTIHDSQKMTIETSFIRVEQDSVRARLKFRAQKDPQQAVQSSYSVILYAAAESPEHELIDPIDLESFQTRKSFSIKGTRFLEDSKERNFQVDFNVLNGEPLLRSFLTKNSRIDQLKESVMANLYSFPEKKGSTGHPFYVISNGRDDGQGDNHNFIAYQIVFREELEVEIVVDLKPAELEKKPVDFDKEFQSRVAQFDRDFEERFPMNGKGWSEEKIRFARSILSNTVGGISYFYGYSVVRDDDSEKIGFYGPVQLLTAVPSRPTFPRGFLWDEGFHQLLIGAWNASLARTCITSWFDLMNAQGWIPREVVLGHEAMARVPSEYLVQMSSNANPPSMLFAIEALIDADSAPKEWLDKLYPRLQQWYHWFNSTQSGPKPTSFRWRGRNATTVRELNPKTLASGLDDVPRSTNPTNDEMHVDLRCWMALASRVLSKISAVLHKPEADAYEHSFKVLKDNKMLEKLHWNDQEKMFSDWGLHSRNVSLEEVQVPSGSENTEVRKVRVFHEYPTYGFVPDMSYISLFPFMMQLLEPDNLKLKYLLDSIEDPQKYWTPYGLRSLAANSNYYLAYNTQHDPPYWRGAIWINMNYLTLKALHHYKGVPGPFQQRCDTIYTKLRSNLVENMFTQFQKSGFIWEQYNDRTGEGKGTRPFTGWSALIVRIMGDRY